jgi:hypothetical protein
MFLFSKKVFLCVSQANILPQNYCTLQSLYIVNIQHLINTYKIS